MKITIIANPVAGRGVPFRKVQRLVERWPYSCWEVEMIPTRGPEHAGVIAREMLGQPPDILAVCGGDGSLKEVATGLPDPPFPVAILPAGTSNVLAREFGLPLDPVRAVDVALGGVVRRVDLGSLRARADHKFLLMAGIGFDARTAAMVRPATKKRLGIFAYYVAVTKSLMTYDFDEFKVITENADLPATSCVIANSKGYGGGLRLTPQASMTDGMLDALVIQRASRLEYARFILHSLLGKPLNYPFLRYLKSASFRVEGPRGLWVQADGEPVGSLPINITVVPGKFPIVVPASPPIGRLRAFH